MQDVGDVLEPADPKQKTVVLKRDKVPEGISSIVLDETRSSAEGCKHGEELFAVNKDSVASPEHFGIGVNLNFFDINVDRRKKETDASGTQFGDKPMRRPLLDHQNNIGWWYFGKLVEERYFVVATHLLRDAEADPIPGRVSGARTNGKCRHFSNRRLTS